MIRKTYISRLLACVALMCVCGAAWAQDPKLEVSAPSPVAPGDNFRVEFTTTVNPDPESFTAPSFEGFKVVAGPQQAVGGYAIYANGQLVEVPQVMFTYVLQATAEGRFTIGAATIVHEGRTIASQPLLVEVAKNNQQSGGAASVAGDDILLRVSTNKTRVFKGEPVRVTFKLYSRVSIGTLENARVPSFTGFWQQELGTRQYPSQRETYNSKVYSTEVVKEYLLFPQQSGTLQIEPYEMVATAQIVNHRSGRSLADGFFGGGPEIEEVKKRIASQQLRITVNDLPNDAPAGFGGAVGSFTMDVDAPQGAVAANSAATYTVKISGRGNLPMIQAPTVAMPASFEQYPLKTTESLAASTEGISGYRQFEYPFIARGEGDYTIPTVEFSYFNPETSRYVTLAGDEVALTVLPDSTRATTPGGGVMISAAAGEQVVMLGEDIRFIKIGAPALRRAGTLFAGSPFFWAIIAGLVALFAALCAVMRRRTELMRNVELVRGKRANKVALSRLRLAGEYVEKGDRKRFYDEMLRALWGYMSDKLNIPVAHLTKESMRDELDKRGVPAERTSRYIEIITECEYAQYSPDGSTRTGEVYSAALAAITRMESDLKK